MGATRRSRKQHSALYLRTWSRTAQTDRMNSDAVDIDFRGQPGVRVAEPFVAADSVQCSIWRGTRHGPR